MLSYLDHFLHATSGLLQDGDDVLAAGLRLLCNRTLHQVTLGIRGDLARDKDVWACNDGLSLVTLHSQDQSIVTQACTEYVEADPGLLVAWCGTTARRTLRKRECVGNKRGEPQVAVKEDQLDQWLFEEAEYVHRAQPLFRRP